MSHEVGCLAREKRRGVAPVPQMEPAIVAVDRHVLRQPFEAVSQMVDDICDRGS